MKISIKQRKTLFLMSNVVGVGFGKKITEGKKTNRHCVAVLVTKKLPASQLSPKNLVPKKINSMETDVVEVGVIRPLAPKKTFVPKTSEEHTSKRRPAIGGISIGHEDITAGTFGCVVYKNNEKHILSNNHVLANSNEAAIGDPILQPGPYDGGTVQDQIAILSEFVPISFGVESPICKIANFILWLLNWLTHLFKEDYTWKLEKQTGGVNYVDAALAKPLEQGLVEATILEIGQPLGVALATVGMPVQKSGRTTGLTQGYIEYTDASVKVQYGLGKEALFEDQIVAGPISQGGDSGSAVLTLNDELVGLLFAGSDEVTIINPIGRVFSALDISLSPGGQPLP
ncbi:hypothetical protein JW930_00480 [Candidatus Woesearchaeota archaeon]|nr:hypothetical protein [Candidatus Woesearchaeota archaeon]